MKGPANVVAIIAVLGALVLAYRGLQSHELSFHAKARLATIWAVIIVGLVVVLSWLGA